MIHLERVDHFPEASLGVDNPQNMPGVIFLIQKRNSKHIHVNAPFTTIKTVN